MTTSLQLARCTLHSPSQSPDPLGFPGLNMRLTKTTSRIRLAWFGTISNNCNQCENKTQRTPHHFASVAGME